MSKAENARSMAHTIIEIKPHRSGGWQSFEAPGVEPFFGEKRQALDYAIERMRSRSGQIHVFNEAGELEEVIPNPDQPGRKYDLSFGSEAIPLRPESA
jgi:hypothetical protein